MSTNNTNSGSNILRGNTSKDVIEFFFVSEKIKIMKQLFISKKNVFKSKSKT